MKNIYVEITLFNALQDIGAQRKSNEKVKEMFSNLLLYTIKAQRVANDHRSFIFWKVHTQPPKWSFYDMTSRTLNTS